MSQVTLTWELDWGNNLAQKISGKVFTKPDGTYVDCTQVSGTIHCSAEVNKIYVTIVPASAEYGFIDDVLVDIEGENPTGLLVQEYNDRAIAESLPFTIRYETHLKQGSDGSYRVGLYAQGEDGFWNYEYFFLTASGEYFVLSDGSEFLVPTWTDLK